MTDPAFTEDDVASLAAKLAGLDLTDAERAVFDALIGATGEVTAFASTDLLGLFDRHRGVRARSGGTFGGRADRGIRGNPTGSGNIRRPHPL